MMGAAARLQSHLSGLLFAENYSIWLRLSSRRNAGRSCSSTPRSVNTCLDISIAMRIYFILGGPWLVFEDITLA